MSNSLFTDLICIVAAGFLGGAVCRRLGISLLPGYLIAGTMVGPGVLGLVVGGKHEITDLAEAGVLLLLFSVGLEFSLDDVFRRGRALFIAGVMQMTLSAAPFVIVLSLSGIGWRSAALIGAAISLSSTVLVFKALAEWGQVGTPQGRRAVGVLLFQDIALVPLLLLMPLLTGVEQREGVASISHLVLVSAGVISSVILLRVVARRWVIPLLSQQRSAELVVLFTMAMIGAVVYAVFTAGLPAPLGAFAAGLILNGNRLTRQIDALVLPLRELFAAVFFVSLGMLLDPLTIYREPVMTLTGLTAVVVVKSVAAALALRATGLGWRSAWGMGLGLSQMGEFAFVLLATGQRVGLLSTLAYQEMLAIAMGSLLLTPPLLRVGLRWATGYRSADDVEEDRAQHWHARRAQHAVVIGAGPIGMLVVSRLEMAGVDSSLIDISPVNLHAFAQQGFHTVAGDATDTRVLKEAGIERAQIVIVTVPDDEVGLRIVRAARTANNSVRLLARCRYNTNRGALLQAGADAVVSEEVAASEVIIELISEWIPKKDA